MVPTGKQERNDTKKQTKVWPFSCSHGLKIKAMTLLFLSLFIYNLFIVHFKFHQGQIGNILKYLLLTL